MTERDKLQAKLKNYYEQQAYEVPAGTWQEIAAQQGLLPKRKKRRGLVLLFLAVLCAGIVGVLFIAPSAKPEMATTTVREGVLSEPPVKTIVSSAEKVAVPSIKKQSSAKLQSLPILKSSTIDKPGRPVTKPIAADESLTAITAQQLPIAEAAAQMPEQTGASQSPGNLSMSTTHEPHSSANASTAVNKEESTDETRAIFTSVQASAQNTIDTKAGQVLSETQSPSDTAQKYNALFLGNKLNAVPVQSLQADSAVELAKKDSTHLNLNEARDTTKILFSFDVPLREGLQVDVGTYWSYGYAAGDKRDARGFSASAGMYYSTAINSRFWLAAGLRYLEVRNLSYSSKTSRTSTFTYGENSTITTITPFSLHYLSIPISCAYVLSPKHQIGMTAAFNYLFNVSAKIKEVEQRQGSVNTPTEYKQSGYVQGITWLDMQALVFYRYRFNASFAAQAEIMKGLSDVKENNFFSLQQRESNNGFRMSIVYYLPTNRKEHVH